MATGDIVHTLAAHGRSQSRSDVTEPCVLRSCIFDRAPFATAMFHLRDAKHPRSPRPTLRKALRRGRTGCEHSIANATASVATLGLRPAANEAIHCMI